MSRSARKRRSLWDEKEENQLSPQTNEQPVWQDSEIFPRHWSHDQKSSDLDAENALRSTELHDRPSRGLSPGKGSRGNARREFYESPQISRPGSDVKSYPSSPRSYGPGHQNHSHSPEGSWAPPHRRSRSRSRGRARGRSRSPSRGRNRSRSLSKGRERERVRGHGRSQSPSNDYRREPYRSSDRRSGFGAPPQLCRGFAAGTCRRGSQCRFIHPDYLAQRDGGRSERSRPERWEVREEHGGNRYNIDREEHARNNIKPPNICNDFLKGRCQRGSSCRFSHHDAANDHSHKRQPPANNPPCRFYMVGNCSRNDCRFSHDVAMHDNREVELPQNDRNKSDYEEKKRSWNGPTWDDSEKLADVKNEGRNVSTWNDVTELSNLGRTNLWGDSGNANVKTTDQMISKSRAEDKSNPSLDGQGKIWTAADTNDDVDMDIAGPEVPEKISELEPQSTLDGMQYQIPYGFSKIADASFPQQPSSTVPHLAFSENHQIYSKMGGNVLMPGGFESVNGGGIYRCVEQTTLPPGLNINPNSESCGLQAQHFGQRLNSVNPSDLHSLDPSGPEQENLSSFKVQNTMEKQGESMTMVVNHDMPQKIDNKPLQITNLPAPLTEKFVNELPQLYAALNPPRSAGPVPDYPASDSTNVLSNQPTMYHKHNGDGIEPKRPDNINQYPGFTPSTRDFHSSPSANQKNGGPLSNNLISSELSQQKPALDSVHKEQRSKPIAEQSKQKPENKDENVETDAKVGDGTNGKDEKAMRLFKVSLVEFVKEILKPKWKEGQMSREVHKAIVKKVVDKVTSATQGVNIPCTQAKLDQYLQYSKPKLSKLVEAYTERFHKGS